MDLTIITPFYKGNKYINQYLNSVSKAISNSKYDVEVLIINDSPEYEIKYNEGLASKINYRIISNKTNQGIHKSRIKGLEEAKGKYILFLDQDDLISENSINSQIEFISDHNVDVALGNGYNENEDGRFSVIYKNNIFAKWATNKKVYLKSRNFIISPGQCILKSSEIPQEWKRLTLKVNGADDYLLWILYFCNNKKIGFNNDFVYIHKYTGTNLSDDIENMHNSQLNMLKNLKDIMTKKDYIQLEKTFEFKYLYKTGNKKAIFKYPYIYIYNVFCSLTCNKIITIKENMNDFNYLSKQ